MALPVVRVVVLAGVETVVATASRRAESRTINASVV